MILPWKRLKRSPLRSARNPFQLHFDYLGLNHLGWVRSIRDDQGEDLLPKVLSSPEIIEKCYRHGLFPAEFIQRLGLLPTEYLYFYYFPQAAYNYFSIEATAGERRKEHQELYSEFSGYERIALLVLQALHTESPSVIPLTVRNAKALEDLDPNDAVELPCEVSSHGVQALPVGRGPEVVRPCCCR